MDQTKPLEGHNKFQKPLKTKQKLSTLQLEPKRHKKVHIQTKIDRSPPEEGINIAEQQ